MIQARVKLSNSACSIEERTTTAIIRKKDQTTTTKQIQKLKGRNINEQSRTLHVGSSKD